MLELNKTPWATVALADEKAKTAEITIDGVIGAYDYDADTWQEAKRLTKQAMRKELKALADLKVEKIRIDISSPGGDTDHALAMHDLIRQNPAEVTTRVYGQTASAATILSQAADKGKRYISENALFLVHKCMNCLWGYYNANDLAEILGDQEKVTGRMLALYAKRSGHDAEELGELLEANAGRGRWLDPEEAMAFGLVDVVYEPNPTFSLWTPAQMDMCMLPPIPEAYVIERTPEESGTDTDGKADLSESPPPQSAHEQEEQIMLTKEQMASLKARFGAEFAMSQIEADAEYSPAVEAGAEMLGTQLAAVQTERDTAQARVAELETQVAGLKDPIEADEKREKPPEEEPPEAPKAIPEAHAALVESGKTDREAWAELRKTRPEDYAAHFGN